MAKAPPRPRKRAKPSFDAPADVTSAPESGWVFRSDAPAAPVPTPAVGAVPTPAPVKAAPPPVPVPPAPVAVAPPPAPSAPAAAPRPVPVVMAPVIESESPLRFAWVPIAIGVSTILAMLPRRRE